MGKIPILASMFNHELVKTSFPLTKREVFLTLIFQSYLLRLGSFGYSKFLGFEISPKNVWVFGSLGSGFGRKLYRVNWKTKKQRWWWPVCRVCSRRVLFGSRISAHFPQSNSKKTIAKNRPIQSGTFVALGGEVPLDSHQTNHYKYCKWCIVTLPSYRVLRNPTNHHNPDAPYGLFTYIRSLGENKWPYSIGNVGTYFLHGTCG